MRLNLKEMASDSLVTYSLGLDIGGTKISAVLMQGQTVLEANKLATPKDDFNHLLIMIKAALEPLLEKAKKDQATVSGLGVGVAGTLNRRSGRVLVSPNLPILNNTKLLVKIRELLQLTMPLKLDNDANCFTRGEALLGAGVGCDNLYGLTIGTGIGGGWWHGGKIYLGAHGGANEPGSMLINLDEKITLEQAYQKLTQNNPRLLAQEAYEGDVLAEKCFEELGRYLGLALANIVNLFDPEMIIIGGGVSASSDLFLKTATKTMKKHLASPEAKQVKIVQSKLGDNAGAIGAALIN